MNAPFSKPKVDAFLRPGVLANAIRALDPDAKRIVPGLWSVRCPRCDLVDDDIFARLEQPTPHVYCWWCGPISISDALLSKFDREELRNMTRDWLQRAKHIESARWAAYAIPRGTT